MSDQNTDSEVMVIGAGPAGSMAALLLARAGGRVSIVEQHRFPRDKVCGECISAVGVDVLRRAGLLGRLETAGAVWMRRFVVHAPDGGSAGGMLPRPMLGISRWVLDELLLEAAREAGAVVWQPMRCEGLDGGVRLRDLQTNRMETVSPRIVLLADGRSSLLGEHPALTGDMGIKAHFTGAEGARDAVELFGADGCYGGIAPIEGGGWNIAFSVPAERLKRGRGVEGAFEEIVRGNGQLAARLGRARRCGEWMASPLPRYAVREQWPAGVIPIGNAAAAIEPIGGEGMGLALRSAEMAAEAAACALAGGGAVALDELRERFASLWRIRRPGCRLAALAVSHPRLCSISVEAMRSFDWAAPAVLGWIGKH